MTTRFLDTIDSPAGPLHIAVDEAGRLTDIWFSAVTERNDVESGIRRAGHALIWDADRAGLVAEQFREYAAGSRTAFDLELAPTGRDWERRVWDALLTIPYGETRSYGQIATQLGDPSKARAVGWANAANPIPVVIPCHRVIGANRGLTGFGGGIDAKIKLLAHEGALLPGFA